MPKADKHHFYASKLLKLSHSGYFNSLNTSEMHLKNKFIVNFSNTACAISLVLLVFLY